jgi:hypothetical protein
LSFANALMSFKALRAFKKAKKMVKRSMSAGERMLWGE